MEHFALRAMAYPAVNHADFDVKKTCVVFERNFHLGREFPSGLQNQAAWRFAVLGQQRKQGKGESGGFAGTRLSGPHEVAPRKDHGYRL